VATSPTWRVVLADDHLVVRAGLKMLLSADPRCVVVGEASTLDELRAVVCHVRPDLVVLDITFGAANALDAIPDLLTRHPGLRVVVLTMHDDVAFVREAFAAGAHGYLVKEAAADDLARAVETVMSGATYLHPELGARFARAQSTVGQQLSPRERQVLTLLARGHTNVEIAGELLVSLRTVEAHRARLRARLGATNRAGLVEVAQRLGLL
jgi:two-component system, NarL family, response regulator NreC